MKMKKKSEKEKPRNKKVLRWWSILLIAYA
jgi:hypothetical protein